MENITNIKNENTATVSFDSLTYTNNVINEIYKYTERAKNFKLLSFEAKKNAENKLQRFVAIVSALAFVLILCIDFWPLRIMLLCPIIGALFLWSKRDRIPMRSETEMYERKSEENRKIADKIAQENQDALELIPAQYRYPLASNYIVELFANGRATTIPEALDKYEEQLHRWRLEESMQIQISLQEAQLETLVEIYKWNRIF